VEKYFQDACAELRLFLKCRELPIPATMKKRQGPKNPTIRPSLIKNKVKRAQVWAIQKENKKKARREKRARNKEAGPDAVARKKVLCLVAFSLCRFSL